MEEKQIPQKAIKLIQKSGTYNYKLVIPAEVERKIRFACQKVWNTEWSGTLFFTHEGSFANNDLVIKCVDIYIMDIGNATYTEFDMNPDVIAYMTNNPELLDCQLGLIHSHCTFATFFSGTDTATLKEEGRDRNNFVSLIVNNAGTYTAAITRRITSKQVTESVSYEFFGDGEKYDTNDYIREEDEIEWFYLKIEKENNDFTFPEMDARLEEIRKQKMEKAKEVKGYPIIGYSTPKEPIIASSYFTEAGPANLSKPVNKDNEGYVQKSFFDNEKEIEPVSEELDYNLPYGQVSVKPEIIESIVRQLITCSIIIPNESKVDTNKWAENMTKIYEKRFGKGEEGLKRFKEWADVYIEFLTWNIEDDELECLDFQQTDIQSIYAYDLTIALSKLPTNKFIKAYIDELEKYLMV